MRVVYHPLFVRLRISDQSIDIRVLHSRVEDPNLVSEVGLRYFPAVLGVEYLEGGEHLALSVHIFHLSGHHVEELREGDLPLGAYGVDHGPEALLGLAHADGLGHLPELLDVDHAVAVLVEELEGVSVLVHEVVGDVCEFLGDRHFISKTQNLKN